MAFSLFFFEPEKIKNLFLKKKPLYTKNEVITKNYKPILVAVGVVYFNIQIALPLRQHFFKDNVLWTEEGHRLSWRMMLRSKSGRTSYKVVDKATNTTENINMSDYLTKKQIRTASCKPDVIWQFAQHLKKTYAKKGKDVKVFVDAKISVNGRPYQRLIDKNTDLASVPWYWAKHNDWILPSQLDK